MYRTIKLRTKLLLFVHLGSLFFILFHITNQIDKAHGVVGTVNIQPSGNTFQLTATAASGGSLAASTNYYLRTAVYTGDGSTQALLSPIAKCTTTASNKTCSLSWPAVSGVNNYKVFYSTTPEGIANDATSVTYKQPSPVTTASLSMADTTQTGTATVPATSVSSQINKFSGTGDFYIMEASKKLGFNTRTPSEEVEVNGDVLFNFNKTFTNAASPTGNSDLATKDFVKTQCATYCGGAGYCP